MMKQKFEELKNEISGIMENEINTNVLGQIRSFLAYCEETLTPEDYTEEEKRFFEKLSDFLLDERNMMPLGETEYYRINADLLRLRNKLEVEKEFRTKLLYLVCTVSYTKDAIIVAEESVEENALPIEYMNEAIRIFKAMTDEEKHDSAVCYNMGEIFYKLAGVWSDFDTAKCLDYFLNMLSVIEGGKQCFTEELENSEEAFEEYMGQYAGIVNWIFFKAMEKTEDPDERDRFEAMWAEMLRKWLPIIDKYTERDDEDDSFVSALMDAYMTLADNDSTGNESAYANYAKANEIGRKRFAAFGDDCLCHVACSFYCMALTSAGAKEKAALEMALLSYKLVTKVDPGSESAKATIAELTERKRNRAGIYGETISIEYIRLLNEYVEDWGKGLELNELYEGAAEAYRFAQGEARKHAEREETDEARRLQYLTANRFIDFVEKNKDSLPTRYQLTVTALKNETEQLGNSLDIKA